MDPMLFSLDCDRAFAAAVAGHLDLPLADHEERDFEDGEHKLRALVNVRNRHIFIVQALYGDADMPVDEKIVRLLFFIAALKEASAGRVTAVLPYLAYARKERQTQPRDPLGTRTIAILLEAAGADHVVALDVHNLAGFQNAFRCQIDHLEARPLFVDFLVRALGDRPIVVASPDVGGVKRAERLRRSLAAATGSEIGAAFVEKHRALGRVTGGTVVGDVAGCDVVVVDDLISSGGTILRAAQGFKANKAARIVVAATHGVFLPGANEVLADAAIDQLLITNSIPPVRLAKDLSQRKVVVLDIAPFIAEAIRRIHEGGSIVELLEVRSADIQLRRLA